MAKSIADLRTEQAARPAPLRRERVHRVVVGEGQKYVAEIQRLTEEHDAIIRESMDSSRPRKVGASSPEIPPRAQEIRERLVELGSLMGEYEGELTIADTKTEGEWEQWRIAHPAREEGQPGYLDDLAITRGYCNASALIEDIAAYVVAWEGEPLGPGDFEALSLSRPDKKDIASIVVGLYETGDDLPKLRSGLSALRTSETSSDSPATSG